ncbi:uncharacterized protein [Dermacentor andersoni]|uniref:uncharacterized protein n=1 Tax=Dermacentor andersoni TaxID=34620 RepID=UPI002155EA46|nr:elastin-like [Dermacentor andersoni]
MHCIAILLATACFGLINGNRNCTNCGPEKCGDLEEPAVEKDQKDHFCRPSLTPSWELQKSRRCVCKKGFVRNSWGECISKAHCWRCKLRQYKDWHTCASGCPARCGEPLERSCRKKCKPRCDCPPGFVVHPKFRSKCVKADTCPPRCPLNSSFKPCVSNCEPKCNGKPPERCVNRCDTGGCVCNRGYAYFIRNHQKICVLESACALYAPPPLSFTSKEIESAGQEGFRGPANRPGGAGRRRGGTRSRGDATGPDENLSLGIPRPGPTAVGLRLGSAHPGGMPGLGGAAHGESEEAGHLPFPREPVAAPPHIFRAHTQPPRPGGLLPAGTNRQPIRNFSVPRNGANTNSLGTASRAGLGSVGAGLGVLGAGGSLSRGTERHGGAGIGIHPLGMPSNDASRHGGTSGHERSESARPPVHTGPGGLGVGIEGEGLLSSSAENPEETLGLGTTPRGPAGINLRSEDGHPNGRLGLGGAGVEESEESAPFAGGPGAVLPDVFRTHAQPRGTGGHFPSLTGVNPSHGASFGAIGPRGSDVDIEVFGTPPGRGLGHVENDIERLAEVGRRSGAFGRGGDGIGFPPSGTPSPVSRSFRRSSEESDERAQPSVSNVPDGSSVGLERVGTSSNSSESHRWGSTESNLAGNHSLDISRNETGGAGAGSEGSTLGGPEELGGPNSGESEETASIRSSVRLGGATVGIGTGYDRVRGFNWDHPYGTGTDSFGTPVLGRERYGIGAVGRGSIGAGSHGILRYRGAGVGMHEAGTPSEYAAEYGRPGFPFYPPGTITPDSADLDEIRLDDSGEYIRPSLSMESRMGRMLVGHGSRRLTPIEGHFPAGLGLHMAARLPYESASFGRDGVGINSEVSSRIHRQSVNAGSSVGIHREDGSSSPIARYGGSSLEINPFGFATPGRATYGGEEFEFSQGDAVSRATTGYDRERLLPTGTPALARHIHSGFRFLPRTDTSGIRARMNVPQLMPDPRDSPLRATATLSDNRPGLYHSRTLPRGASGYHGALPHFQTGGAYIPRNAEYELASVSVAA